MLHLASAPFTPFRGLDEWHVEKKDWMVQIKNKQTSFFELKNKRKMKHAHLSLLLFFYRKPLFLNRIAHRHASSRRRCHASRRRRRLATTSPLFPSSLPLTSSPTIRWRFNNLHSDFANRIQNAKIEFESSVFHITVSICHIPRFLDHFNLLLSWKEWFLWRTPYPW